MAQAYVKQLTVSWLRMVHRNFRCVKDSETFKIDYSIQNLKRGIPYTFNCGLASLP